MTNPVGNPMDAVAGLMLERQRYEAWISQLESRRSITPPHVFERVRADYERRLKEVTAQLVGRTAEVQGTMAALTERLARLQTDETSLRDERYEQELRSHVGEMTAEQWAKIEKDSDDRLARISTERASITGEIARLQQLLSMAGKRDTSTPSAGAALARDAMQTRVATDNTSAAPRARGFDELEFLKSVTDGDKSGTAKPGNGPPPRAPTPVDSPASRPSSAVPAAKSRGATGPTVIIPSEQANMPAAATDAAPRSSLTQTGSFPADSSGNLPPSDREQNKASEEAARAEREAEAVPAFLRDVPQEQTKTLRCGDCGAMNYPTEWYCERCGAELAGM